MLVESLFDYTQEEIGDYAAANARLFALAGMSLCRDCAFSLEVYWTYFGRKFAPAWREARDTAEIVRAVAGNALSGGFALRSAEESPGAYTLVFSGGPSEEELAHFGLTQAETDTIWHVFGPICDALDHDYGWCRDGDTIILTVARRA